MISVKDFMDKLVLSDHDRDIMAQIREKENRYGHIAWTTMYSLSEKLESSEAREMVRRVCIYFNHLEEASCGCL